MTAFVLRKPAPCPMESRSTFLYPPPVGVPPTGSGKPLAGFSRSTRHPGPATQRSGGLSASRARKQVCGNRWGGVSNGRAWLLPGSSVVSLSSVFGCVIDQRRAAETNGRGAAWAAGAQRAGVVPVLCYFGEEDLSASSTP